MKDFDAYWAEQEQKPITFKLFGKEESIPPEMPATIVLKIVGFSRNRDDVIPEAFLMECIMKLFGEKKVEEWAKKGISTVKLRELYEWALEQYKTGNNQAPETGAE